MQHRHMHSFCPHCSLDALLNRRLLSRLRRSTRASNHAHQVMRQAKNLTVNVLNSVPWDDLPFTKTPHTLGPGSLSNQTLEPLSKCCLVPRSITFPKQI